jgi:hypothetical protein
MPYNTDKIMNSFNKFFEENQNYSRKELLEFAKKAYDDNYKKSKKVIDENAEKKPLNSYQIFMKEQRVILNKRENERTDGEKKKSTELMKEIAEMWKLQKTRIEKKEDNKPIENEYDKLKERELKNFIKMKEMFNDNFKPKEKKLHIENYEEEYEVQIINNKKELLNNDNKEEENIIDNEDDIMNRLNNSIKKDKLTRL